MKKKAFAHGSGEQWLMSSSESVPNNIVIHNLNNEIRKQYICT